jgi:hypothetical protein
MKKVIAACMLVASLTGSRVEAQAPSQNAALRYWMAFAMMKDPPADQATADLLEQVVSNYQFAANKARWDEARIGPILDANAEALSIMQRGSTLPFCDWGLEYELGSDTPIAHIAKARVLGRLKILEGVRLFHQNRFAEAADAWLAAVRFSQHVANGGTLISALVGEALLTPALRFLGHPVTIRRVSTLERALAPAQLAQIAAVVRSLPVQGVDWDAAIAREAATVRETQRKDPGATMPSLAPLDSIRERARVARQGLIDATR